MIPALGRALEGCRKRDIIFGDSLYLRRFILWGSGGDEDTPVYDGHSGFIHHIIRPDADRHLHDHPWAWSLGVILKGGYIEERQIGDRVVRCTYREGDLNLLMPGTYHRIDTVEEGTWTLFLCGAKHSNSWGFLVNGKHVPHEEYP
jgi:hypothetical protein